MEGKSKFTDTEKQLVLSIVECEKGNIAKIPCRESQRGILKKVYDGIIQKIQANLRFNDNEIECLVELLIERIDCLQSSKDLISIERNAYLVAYERMKFTVQNFREEKSPSEVYITKKRQKSREEILKTKTPILGDIDRLRLQEMNQQ